MFFFREFIFNINISNLTLVTFLPTYTLKLIDITKFLSVQLNSITNLLFVICIRLLELIYKIFEYENTFHIFKISFKFIINLDMYL